MTKLLLVGLGGFLGTCARYLLSDGIARLYGPGFPYGTLAVNVIGSFLMGAIMAFALHTPHVGPTLRLTLTTGCMGGFTTYSAFNYETTRLFEERAWLLGSVNVAATLFGCLAAGLLGTAGARWLIAR